MKASQLKKFIIEPTLKILDLYSVDAVNLLLGTAAQESNMGRVVRQEGLENNTTLGAFGPWQIELRSHDDVIERITKKNSDLIIKLNALKIPGLSPQMQLMGNWYYAAAMCRLFYWLIPLPIPSDLESQAIYYKRYYNTKYGKATIEQYLDNYHHYVE